MKKIAILFIIVITVVTLTACLSPYNGESSGLPEEGTPMDYATDLFIPVEVEDETIGTFRFSTNDPKYRTPSGYTLWTYCSDVVGFQDRTVTVRKPLGSNVAGYGMIICSAQRQISGRIATVFLSVMINNNRQYAVGKVIGGSYIPLVNWTDSTGLHKGIGLENIIRVVKDEENPNKYTLYCNNVNEGFFVDDEVPRCEGMGQNGYIVVIAPDDLDTRTVEVWFSE
jgi:hypothetical protein